MRALGSWTVFLALLTSSACAHRGLPLPAPVMPPVNDTQIVPHSRIGPVSLGMTTAQLLQAMGPPGQSQAYVGGGNEYGWPDREIDAIVSNGVVTQIETGSQTCTPTRYAMPNGLRVGSTELEVQALMGTPAWRHVNGLYVLYCFPDGTDIMFDGPSVTATSGRVRLIKVNGCIP